MALITLDNRLIDLFPAAVYICEAPSCAIRFYNRRAVELWGREPKCDGKYPDKLFCGSLRLYYPDGTFIPHDQTPMARVLRDGISRHGQELIIEWPDGRRISVVANVAPIRDEKRALIGAVCVFEDITECKLAEEALRAYTERLKNLSRCLLEAEETERRNLARKLHEEIGQTLAAVQINLQAMQRSFKTWVRVPHLEESIDIVEHALKQIQNLRLYATEDTENKEQ